MRLKISLLASIALLITVVTPSVMMGFGASSMAPGVTIISIISLFVGLILLISIGKPKKVITLFIIFVIIISVTILSGVQSYILNTSFDTERFIQSIILLLLFLLGALSWSLLSNKLTDNQFDKAVKIVFYILIFTGFISLFVLSPFHKRVKQVFFFSEPSFYAINSASFILYMVVSSPRIKKIFIFSLIILLGVLLQNLTLLLISIIISLYIFNLRKLVIFYTFIFVIILTIGVSQFTYYTTRLDFSSDNSNMSRLAYLSGWERVAISLSNNNGLGVGYQQLGIVGEQGEILQKLDSLGVTDLNLNDGGSVAAKLICEFGIMAVIALLIYLLFLTKTFIYLRNISMKRSSPNNPKLVFFMSCYLMFFVEFFFRGTGYFTSTGFLFITSLIWLSLNLNKCPSASV